MDPYARSRAELFVRTHKGRGHVFIRQFPDNPLALADCAALVPSAHGAWQSSPGDFLLDQYGDILQVAVEVAEAPEFARQPTPHSLSQLNPGVPARLIAYRRPGKPLTPLILAITWLHAAYPHFALWLDQPSMGWDALSYILAVWPEIQAINIPDAEVSHLLDLAVQLQRPVYLHDFGPAGPLPTPVLPEYPLKLSPTWDMTSLPIYPGYL
jgi:hypothetical protein